MKAATFDLVGPQYRIECGAAFSQSFSLYQGGGPGQYVGVVTDQPSATTWTVSVAETGAVLTGITSVPATAWDETDFVLVESIYGTWQIVGPAVLEDMTSYINGHMQIRHAPGSTVLAEAKTSLGNFFIGTAAGAGNSILITLPTAVTTAVPPTQPATPTKAATYHYYDVFLFTSDATAPRKVIQGAIEAASQITTEP